MPDGGKCCKEMKHEGEVRFARRRAVILKPGGRERLYC